MLGKHSASELDPEPKNYICKCSVGHCEGVGMLRVPAPEEVPEPGPPLLPLLFCRTSVSSGCTLKKIAGTEAKELG